MGLLDKILKMVSGEAEKAAKKAITNRTETFTFAEMPKSLDEFKALPEASMDSEYKVAALTVIALCVYAEDENLGIEMMNFLKAPNELSNREKQFNKERLAGKKYVPISFLGGTSPSNDYTPSKPYTVKVSSNPYSYEAEGYAQLWLQSSGADSPRPVKLRKKKDGTWALWDQILLADMRKPESENPWA